MRRLALALALALAGCGGAEKTGSDGPPPAGGPCRCGTEKPAKEGAACSCEEIKTRGGWCACCAGGVVSGKRTRCEKCARAGKFDEGCARDDGRPCAECRQ